MPARRPNHKTAHQPCPFGQPNWADCDEAAAHQWGHCIAITGDKEPTPCSRWSMDADGYCSQHFVSRTEAAKAAVKAAERKAELDARIETHLAWVAEHPSVHDLMPGQKHPATQAESTRGLAGITPEQLREAMAAGAGLEPATSRVTADRSTTELPRKGPYRLDVPPRKGPHRLA